MNVHKYIPATNVGSINPSTVGKCTPWKWTNNCTYPLIPQIITILNNNMLNTEHSRTPPSSWRWMFSWHWNIPTLLRIPKADRSWARMPFHETQQLSTSMDSKECCEHVFAIQRLQEESTEMAPNFVNWILAAHSHVSQVVSPIFSPAPPNPHPSSPSLPSHPR